MASPVQQHVQSGRQLTDADSFYTLETCSLYSTQLAEFFSAPSHSAVNSVTIRDKFAYQVPMRPRYRAGH